MKTPTTKTASTNSAEKLAKLAAAARARRAAKKAAKTAAPKVAEKVAPKVAEKVAPKVAEKVAPKVAEKVAPKVVAPKADGVATLPVNTDTKAGVARKAILAGKTNAEVLSALAKAFPAFATKKHAYYASWYRAQMVMVGVITKEWAREHSGAAAAKPE